MRRSRYLEFCKCGVKVARFLDHPFLAHADELVHPNCGSSQFEARQTTCHAPSPVSAALFRRFRYHLTSGPHIPTDVNQIPKHFVSV